MSAFPGTIFLAGFRGRSASLKRARARYRGGQWVFRDTTLWQWHGAAVLAAMLDGDAAAFAAGPHAGPVPAGLTESYAAWLRFPGASAALEDLVLSACVCAFMRTLGEADPRPRHMTLRDGWRAGPSSPRCCRFC